MIIEDLKVGDELWGSNFPSNAYEVIRVKGTSTYLAIITPSIQEIVRLSSYNGKTIEKYGFFKTREEMIDYRIKKAKQEWQYEIECKNQGF